MTKPHVRLGLAALILFTGSTWAGVKEAASSVTLPIEEYLEMRRLTEKGSLTTLEETRVSGEWGKHLQLSFSGATTGKAEPITVLQQIPGMSLSGCHGAALLKVTEDAIQLLPTAPRFQVSCELGIKNWDRNFSLRIFHSLFVRTDVRGAEPIMTGESMAERQISFQIAETRRSLASEPLTDEPSFQARYQISVGPEETKFQYTLAVHNPGRSAKTFALPWLNGEVVSQVDTTNSYTAGAQAMTFKLTPGDSQIRVTGRLPKPEFHPLLAGKGIEYLLIDNHPLLSLDVQGGNRHVSPKDAGMRPGYASARAYLIGKNENFRWAAKTLDVFSSFSYTVTAANYRYYASERGSPLVEVEFNFDNQGSPEIPLRVPGQATYLEVNGVPQALTKDKDSQLLLRLPSGGNQSVVMQYQPAAHPARALASLGEDLARPPALMTNVSVAVQIPGHRESIFASALDDIQSPGSWARAVRGLLILAVMWVLLGRIGFGEVSRVLVGAGAGVFAAASLKFSVLLLTACILIALMRHRHLLQGVAGQSWRSRFGLAVLVLVLLWGANVLVLQPLMEGTLKSGQLASYDEPAIRAMAFEKRKMAAKSGEMNPLASTYPSKGLGTFARNSPPPPPGAMAEDSAPAPAPAESVEGAGESDNYQGLPARIAMPRDGQVLLFNSGMLDGVSPIHLRLLTVADWLVNLLVALLLIAMATALWSERRHVQNYLAAHR